MELTLAAAAFAGIVSFLSPCVLPVVPAYLGQLGVAAAAVAVAPGHAAVGRKSRWRVLPHALAFVLGFGAIFLVLGLSAYVMRPIFDLPLVRVLGGALLVVLGLHLMGILRIGLLSRSWRPGGQFGKSPLGGAAARNPLAAFALGAIFAVAHTPCVGPTLGAILTLSLGLGAAPEVILLLTAYTAGLGIPFILLALALDGTARLTRPLLRHGRTIELVGGAFVVLIGLAIMFDWLSLLARTFAFLIPQV
ncbi:MAG TPA: cytochrome c biogenesis CcdA family protein [Candidatus Limnocylindrales bacterium]|nr:cytochrome c biogenesis CcdA family protein [Candidatus Limnocylindrales bacterium]